MSSTLSSLALAAASSVVSTLASTAARTAISSSLSSTSSYKTDVSERDRKATSARLRAQHPNRLPIVVEPSSANEPAIDKNKYLVPNDLTMGQLMHIIRKRVRMPAEQALFLLVGESRTIPAAAALIADVYDRHVSSDGHLYVIYSTENAFGC